MNKEIESIIEQLSARKINLVSVPRQIFNDLTDHIDENYPEAGFICLGVTNGKTLNIVRCTSAKTFKK